MPGHELPNGLLLKWERKRLTEIKKNSIVGIRVGNQQ